MLQELVARVVDLGESRVRFQSSLARDLLRKVLAGVEEFEDAADGVDIFIRKVDVARLDGRRGG